MAAVGDFSVVCSYALGRVNMGLHPCLLSSGGFWFVNVF